MSNILHLTYYVCVLRVMFCLLVDDNVNNKVGKFLADLIMADVTDADDE